MFTIQYSHGYRLGQISFEKQIDRNVLILYIRNIFRSMLLQEQRDELFTICNQVGLPDKCMHANEIASELPVLIELMVCMVP